MKIETTWKQSLGNLKKGTKELESTFIKYDKKVTKNNRELVLHNKELKLLRAVDILLAKKSFSLTEVIKGIVVGAKNLIEAEYGDLLLPKDSANLEIVWSTKENLIGKTVPIKGSITGKVMTTGKSQIVNEIKSQPLYHMMLTGMKSELAVPLKFEKGEILGVINIESSQLNRFTSQHRKLVEVLAGQAAIAFRNSKVFDELRTINEMQGHLLSESNAFQKILELIGPRARALVGAEGCQVLRKEGNELIIEYTTGEEAIGTRVLVSDSVSGIAVKSGKPINIHDISKHAQAKKVYQNVLGNMKSEFVVPLIAGEEVLGVINFESPLVGAFKGREYLIKLFADFASMAILNGKRIDDIFLGQQKLAELIMMARIGDIAGNIIHDVNSEVGAIKAIISEIHYKERDLLKSNSFLLARLEDIEAIATRALKYPQVLKSNIESAGKSIDIDVNHLIEEILSEMAKPANIIVDLLNLDPLLDKVHTVLTLKDVLRNIIKNAFQAMPTGGTLKIITRPWKIEQSTEKPIVGIEISISDTGIGIPKKKLEKIFTSAETGKKLGLGYALWWIKQFIRSIEGDISVESEIDHGTTFFVRIPYKTK